MFNPSNSGRIVPSRTAEIGSDGRYTIKTYTGDNRVTYGGELAKKYPGLGLRQDYATVASGENSIDFDVAGRRQESRHRLLEDAQEEEQAIEAPGSVRAGGE